MIVLVSIQKIVDALKWNQFCYARSLPEDELVQAFYANLTMPDATEVLVRKKKLNQIEPDEPKPEESSTNSEPNNDSVNEPEEAKSEGEPNSPKPGMEPNVVEPVDTNANPELTIPMTTPSNINDKSKFSTMMDMWKLIRNKQ
ncbi:hypothetical protein J1N35_007885 [Gossypium stocksii]|uniref:Uncharacterized protein n=1 Tax=Gossypium stocksii TaxID=47602 RepID=A0A9D4ADW0_9ROSI|nr:hypothetical protein J1N35_007885 [Gossypium stocksii]